MSQKLIKFIAICEEKRCIANRLEKGIHLEEERIIPKVLNSNNLNVPHHMYKKNHHASIYRWSIYDFMINDKSGYLFYCLYDVQDYIETEKRLTDYDELKETVNTEFSKFAKSLIEGRKIIHSLFCDAPEYNDSGSLDWDIFGPVFIYKYKVVDGEKIFCNITDFKKDIAIMNKKSLEKIAKEINTLEIKN
jgi:hypothetical protein